VKRGPGCTFQICFFKSVPNIIIFFSQSMLVLIFFVCLHRGPGTRASIGMPLEDF